MNRIRAGLLVLIGMSTVACSTLGAKRSARAPLPENPDAAAIAEYSDQYLSSLFRSRKLTGLAVSVVSPDRVLYSEAWGKAGPDRAFTVDTLTAVASVSKLFTTAAIMRLVEEGLVDLDAPLSRYLPDFQPRTWGPDPDGVTIRALLAHQSGLVSDYSGPGFMPAASWKSQGERPYEALARLVSGTSLCQAPYTIHAYSNVGFALLALVVEKASGMAFNEYLRSRILLPIGMTGSSFAYRPEYDDRYAQGRQGRRWRDLIGIPDTAAGALTSSARELGSFMQAVLKTHSAGLDSSRGGISRPETLARTWTQENAGTELDFGSLQMLGWYGIEARDSSGRQYYGHGGDLPGFHSLLLIDPELHIGATLLVNSDAVDSTGLIAAARELARIWAAAAHGTTPPAADAKTSAESAGEARPSKPNEDQAAFLSGDWASPLGLFRITSVGSRMFLDFMGVPLELLAAGPDSYIAKAKLLHFIPVGHPLIDLLRISAHEVGNKGFLSIEVDGAHGLVLERIEKAELPEAWQGRLGTWKLANAPEEDIMGVNPDKLLLYRDKASGLYCLEVWRDGFATTYPVGSRDRDGIYLRGYGRGLGETLAIERDGGKEILCWLGYRFMRE